MTCNIDARGRFIRLISGLIVAAGGIGVCVALLTGWLTWSGGWWLGAGAIAAGLFQVYEGWAGWCILRALGLRTPI